MYVVLKVLGSRHLQNNQDALSPLVTKMKLLSFGFVSIKLLVITRLCMMGLICFPGNDFCRKHLLQDCPACKITGFLCMQHLKGLKDVSLIHLLRFVKNKCWFFLNQVLSKHSSALLETFEGPPVGPECPSVQRVTLLIQT